MEREHKIPVSERLKSIAEAPIRAKVSSEGNERIVEVNLPFGCSVEGRLIEGSGDYKIMHISSLLRVPKELRGQGIGERLMRGLTVTAKEEGADTLASNIGSPYALAIRRRIFGDNALTFVDPQGYIYDITAEEAMEALREMYAAEPDPENPAEGIDVEVDLTGVDTEGWEMPQRA